jgi:multidrug efflux pump subunit AcrB
MVNNPIAGNLLMLSLLAGGVLASFSITKEYLPDTSHEAVSIVLRYPGASPEEIESGVILALEEATQGLPGAQEIWSISFPGRAILRVRLAEGGDLQQLAQEVQAAVDTIQSFPEEMEKPRVTVDPRRRNVLSLVIYGDADRLVLKDAVETVRDILRATGKVTQMAVAGLPRPQINIDIGEHALREIGMSIDEVASVLRRTSVDLAAGGIKAATGEELIRVRERRDVAREFADVVLVAGEEGGSLRLGQIAKVADGFEENERFARYNGKPAVLLQVYRLGEETPRGIAEAVESSMDEIHAALSGGLKAEVLDNHARDFTQRVELLFENGFLGLVLVLLALGSLLNARLAFWVMMGIPISFLGALLVAPHAGVSINMMSLFAFIVALGIVVDDAIVVGENVYAHHERGASWAHAAIDGTREVARPVTFSIVTNMVAFVPILFMPGSRGKLFWMIPAVVILTFFISLIEALFILPSHLAAQGSKRGTVLGFIERKRRAMTTRLDRFIHQTYAPYLDRVLSSAPLIPFVAVALLLVTTGYMMSGRLGYTSFPRVESDYAYAYIVMPYGTPIEETTRVTRRLVQQAQEIAMRPENAGLVRGIFADVGQGGSHTAELRVFLAEPQIREEIMSTVEFIDRWREGVGEIAGVDSMRFLADQGGPGGGHAMSLELSHRNRDLLKGAADDLMARLDAYPIVTQVSHDFQAGQPQYDLRLTEVGRTLGLDAQSLARQLRGRFYGIEVARQLRARDEITVLVRGTQEERSQKHAFETALVKTPAGTFVPLQQVATVERTRAFTKIERNNGSRVVDVDAEITPRSRTNEVLAEVDAVLMPELRKKFPGIIKNNSGRQRDDYESMATLYYTFPLALLVMFSLLAIAFRSYGLALLTLGMTIPFGFVGALVGHLIMGYPLTIPGLLGLMALTGVLVNDSLILVDFAENARRRGEDYLHAVRTAAIRRFRPIFLTTLTTCAGLAPMILETSRQARFLIPMAISLVFGLALATTATLLFLPATYVLLGQRGLLPKSITTST